MHACRAECSLSTSRNSQGNSPAAIMSAIPSTIVVCGVIGYAATTWTRASFAARDCAWLPVSMRCIASLLLHRDRPRPALDLADPAALAVIVVDHRPPLAVDRDRHVRAELPAHVALRAPRPVDDRPERAPAAGLLHAARDVPPQRTHGDHVLTAANARRRTAWNALSAARPFASRFCGTSAAIAARTDSRRTSLVAPANAPTMAVLTMGTLQLPRPSSSAIPVASTTYAGPFHDGTASEAFATTTPLGFIPAR